MKKILQLLVVLVFINLGASAQSENNFENRVAGSLCPLDSDHVFSWDTLHTWQLTERDYFSYNRGNETSQLNLFLINGAWSNNYMTTCTYDVHNNRIDSLLQLWNDTSGWVGNQSYAYAYNSNNYRTNGTQQGWNGSGWVNYFQDTLVYDVNNNLITDTYNGWNDSVWVLSGKYIYTYDSANNRTSWLQLVWNGINSWDSVYLYTYAYDSSHNPTGDLSQTWTGLSWYDLNVDTLSYDANNNLIKWLDESYYIGSWHNNALNNYTYSLSNNLLSWMQQFWNDTAWLNADSTYYYYGCGGVPLGINEQNQSPAISLYPNPAGNQLIIQSSLPQTTGTIISVRNMLGEIVLSRTFTFEENGSEASLDISKLSSGIYFVHIANESQRWAGKFVKE